jgi:hypothetical protein
MPAARAARNVAETGRDERHRAVSRSTRVGQLAVFVVAIGLLLLYTLSDQLARDDDVHVRVDWISLALLAVAAGVVAIPWLTRSRGTSGAAGVELAGHAHDAALTAASVTLGHGVADADVHAFLAGRPSPALARATVDPRTSIELSRRALAAELRRLAAVAGISEGSASLVEYADELFDLRWLSAAEAGAIGELTAVIDATRAAGSVAPTVAQDIDAAVQLLVPLLDVRADQASARFARQVSQPPFDAATLDAAEEPDDELDEPFELDDELDETDDHDGPVVFDDELDEPVVLDDEPEANDEPDELVVLNDEPEATEGADEPEPVAFDDELVVLDDEAGEPDEPEAPEGPRRLDLVAWRSGR